MGAQYRVEEKLSKRKFKINKFVKEGTTRTEDSTDW